METIKIDNKEYKVSKAVNEHIKWLQIELDVKKQLANEIDDLLDELEAINRQKIEEISNRVNQLRKFI